MSDDRLLGRNGRRWLLVLSLCGGLLLVLVLAAVITSATNSSKIRDTQLEGTPTGKKLVAASDRILDCTDPDGECYKQSQKRTASAIGDIGAANILAVVCALQVPNGTPLNDALEQVTDCVSERLSKARKP